MMRRHQMLSVDERYMRRCFKLAACGLGNTSPNPLVGSVIVNNGVIVSEGFHQRHGTNHAERNAIMRCREHGESDRLKGATLYVNLEPCSHFGFTPPCADLIVESGISRVVCCNDDPNPLVAGRGFAKLQDAGIEVVRHVLNDEGRRLNRRFFTFFEQHRPYVILKWAESADGFMAPTYSPYWISSPQQTLVSHLWRTQESAILVGSQTYLDDHPRLSPRLAVGPAPQPIVWDRRNRLCNVPNHWIHAHQLSVQALLDDLYNRKLLSLIVEGGRQVLDAFIDTNLYDEVRVFRSPKIFGSGLQAPNKKLHNLQIFY